MPDDLILACLSVPELYSARAYLRKLKVLSAKLALVAIFRKVDNVKRAVFPLFDFLSLTHFSLAAVVFSSRALDGCVKLSSN